MLSNKILVVDDEQEITDMMNEYLSSIGYQVETALSMEEARSALSCNQFGLCIVDIFLGPNRLGGVELTESLRSSRTPVVLISGNASLEALKRAINAGTRYFFEKPFDLKELEIVCKEVMSGGVTFEQKFEKMVGEKQLTPREVEIFRLLSKGLSNKEISENIQTSERTVKAHISSIFKKFEVSSRAELLSRLIE